MKQGIEVEGRFKGLRTLLCGSAAEFYMFIMREKELSSGIQNVYVSDNNNELDLTHLNLWWHRGDVVMAPNYIVTIERTSIPPLSDVPQWVHFILNASNDSFFNLRPQDQVKFDKDLNVYVSVKETMIRTYPQDFDGDIAL